MRTQQGVTLIEMLISLAIVAIVASAVAPSIQSILIKNRIVAEINDISAVIQFARSQAIDEQFSTVVCPSENFSDCSTDWDNPKIVFVDADNDGNRGEDETLLATSGKISDNNTLTSTTNTLLFAASGESSANATLLLCNNSKEAEYARSLTITLQGRVKASSDSDRDGIYEDPDGNALSCD